MAKAGPVAGVGASLLEDAEAELRRGLDPLHLLGQDLCRRLQPAQLGPALVAALDVALQVRGLGGVKCPQQVGGEIVAAALVIAVGHASPSANSPRIFSKPSLIRPLTVPIGTPSIRAISE